MQHSKTIGEKGRTDEPLFGCPLCHRHGFSAAGLRNHRCHALPRPSAIPSPGGEGQGEGGRKDRSATIVFGQRRRLHPDIVDAIIENRPPNLSGPLYL